MKSCILIILGLFTFQPFLIGQNINWEGFGIGDSYLEIKDSIVTFNFNDSFSSECKIEEITNDSIACGFYDLELGEFKYRKSFVHSNDFKKNSD